MKTQTIDINYPRGSIILGKQGESNAIALAFDLSAWVAAYGEGTAQVLVQRPGEGAPYISTADFADGVLTWPITSLETAIEGHGQVQIVYKVDGAIVKTQTYNTRVDASLGETTDPPDPWKSWVDQVLEAAQNAETSAEAAQAAAQSITSYTFADNNGNIIIEEVDANG